MELPPVVGFIDMDCFYVAVERARDARLNGKPCAVVQYNTSERGRPDLHADSDRWHHSTIGSSMGGIIAVSYEARARGVTRQMMGKEARKVCPEIILVQVPTAFGKADLRIYKAAGDEVVALLAKRADATEKRSVDEVAVDITSEAERILAERDWFLDIVPAARQATHLADSAVSRQAASVSRNDTRKGHDGHQQSHGALGSDFSWDSLLQQEPLDPIVKRLVAGAVVTAELRSEVKAKLGFSCSGGIATNKVLAKLGCGLHKPDQQTILLPHAVPLLLQSLPIDRLPGLGGDLGANVMSEIGVATAGDLLQRREDVLRAFPERGEWIIALASGMDSAADSVKDRQLVKSLSNGKTFFGSKALRTVAEVEYWFRAFAGELHQRYMDQVLKHHRAPTSIGIHVTVGACSSWLNRKGSTDSFSRQQPISLGRCGTVAEIASAATSCFQRWFAGTQCQELFIVMMGLNLGKFVDLDNSAPIKSFFGKAASTSSTKSSTCPPSIGTMTDLISASSSAKTQGKNVASGGSSIKAFFAKSPASKSTSTAVQAVAGVSHAQHPSSRHGLNASQFDEEVFAQLPTSIQKEIAEQLRLPHHVGSCKSIGTTTACDVATPQRKKLRQDCQEVVEIEID
mmetsp:Transcript_12636/g.20925  ORF Transcript_12636/g.20925 Transcript_12636/m.20925 type:complete len:628 (-) Transcript_12636:60-1943(-)